MDKPRDACGVCAVVAHPDAVRAVRLGLYALQHRGQESAGIVCRGDAADWRTAHGSGLVLDALNDKAVARMQDSTAACGHVRYSTQGGNSTKEIQPFFNEALGVALAHNGNVTNSAALRKHVRAAGIRPRSTSDSELILHMICLAYRTCGDWVTAIREGTAAVFGAFSLVLLTEDAVYAVRDPHGIRPLVTGMVGSAACVASESCALDVIGAKNVQDVAAGSIVRLDASGIRVVDTSAAKRDGFCVFEYIYFMRPNSVFADAAVSRVREYIGAALYDEAPVTADAVVPVPDSGMYAAIGFAQKAGIPLKQALVRSHYTGRTFIQPSQLLRESGVQLKFSVNAIDVVGKTVVVVDDSIVRGTTMKIIVGMLRRAGAAAVHVRIACPPFLFSCQYGIDIPDQSALLITHREQKDISAKIGADSAAYLSLEKLRSVLKTHGPHSFCDGCFSGTYPMTIDASDRTGAAL